MAPRDRLAALQLMDRVKHHEMETIGAELARLRIAQKEIEDQSAQLQHESIRESCNSTEETRKFLPAYLKSVERRQHLLSEQRYAAAEKAATAEEKLFASFRESKTTERVLGRVAQEIALEESRALTVEMYDAVRSSFLLVRAQRQQSD